MFRGALRARTECGATSLEARGLEERRGRRARVFEPAVEPVTGEPPQLRLESSGVHRPFGRAGGEGHARRLLAVHEQHGLGLPERLVGAHADALGGECSGVGINGGEIGGRRRSVQQGVRGEVGDGELRLEARLDVVVATSLSVRRTARSWRDCPGTFGTCGTHCERVGPLLRPGALAPVLACD